MRENIDQENSEYSSLRKTPNSLHSVIMLETVAFCANGIHVKLLKKEYNVVMLGKH